MNTVGSTVYVYCTEDTYFRLWQNAPCQSPEIQPTFLTQTSPVPTKLQVTYNLHS